MFTMDKHNKRLLSEDACPSSKLDPPKKKPHSSSDSQNHQNSPQNEKGKRLNFASHLQTPNLPPKRKLICEIIANTPSPLVEKVLDDTGIRVSPQDVEEVLKLCYGFPGPTVIFFRWAGHQLNDKHSPYAWNLVVDLLGKNCLFDAMWDAIKSMKKEGLVSLATFASVFGSYVDGDRVQEAIMTFGVMDQYGCAVDVVALNSLVSAICRGGKTFQANEFLGTVKGSIRPDYDTYAILLEGWANEKNVACAKQTYGEMIKEFGYDPSNVHAYDVFLTMLLKGCGGIREAMVFFDIMRARKCYPGMNFLKVALEECLAKGDVESGFLLWEAMLGGNGFRPDTEMYNSVIALRCFTKQTDIAVKLLDEMVYKGTFPDSKTYNVLFLFFLKGKKLKEAAPIFTEMIKNECVPSQDNCKFAIRVYLEGGDPQMAIKVWKCMIENYDSDLGATGNSLVLGLHDIGRLPEAVKYAEGMLDRGIRVSSFALSTLKHSLRKADNIFIYSELLRKSQNLAELG